ncbi:MAG TPA: OPT family oligopeptide transporter [Polyangiaceae bacterium]
MQGSPLPQLTARAIVAGCGLGVLLAAGNVYTGIKTGYVDGGSIAASVVAFALFARRKARSADSYSPAENNLSQTIASSAAMMASTTGVVGPIAALSMAGHHYPSWAIALWGVALGALGIIVARSLRERLIVVEALPFPTGRATGEVIDAMHSARSTRGRARVLFIALSVATIVTWFRDARPVWLPQALILPVGHAALSAASLWLGVSLSPVMLAAGSLIGPRAGVSVLFGAVGAWGILAPAVLAMKWVTAVDYASLLGWLLWPGVALLVSGTLTSFLMDWRGIVRSLRDLRPWLRPSARIESAAARSRDAPWAFVAVASVFLTLLIGWGVFGVHPLVALLALALAFVLAGVCARAAGETDIAPAGAGGALGQILLGAPGLVTSLFSGGVIFGTVAQTAQTMWAFKAGHRLRAHPRAQTVGQLLGAVLGAVVVVPVYTLLLHAYELGTPTMPAPGAISWKATAEAVQLGTAAMPSHAAIGASIAFLLGIALTLLGRTRFARWLPSPLPLGIAFLIPAPLSGAIFVGGATFAILRAWRPTWTDENVPSLAAGAIAGESLTGILIAALLASGVLPG